MIKADSQMIADEILESIVSQINVSMIGDSSLLTKDGLTELIQRLTLANSLLDDSHT